jgi:putative oxidoreductase
MSVDTHELITPSPKKFDGLDHFAILSGDAFALVGRILVGWIFIVFAYANLTNMAGLAAYLTALKVPAPMAVAWIATIAQALMGISLILGVATRYGALIGLVFVAIATLLAHRYWEFPAAQANIQFTHFMKNLSIFGGLLLLFVTGAGRFSIDGHLRKNE